MSLNWINSRPKKYYKDCVNLFGKPTALSKDKHGFAFWKTKGLFSEHLLRDEDVKHCVPRNHHDYFYSSIKFYVPKNKLLDVLKISGSLNYDGLKKLLTARCGGIGANYATLYLAMLVADGKLSIKDVKKNDLYPRMIRGEIIPHNELHKIMYQLKKKNNKRYKKELNYDYATYAYDKCYKQKGGSQLLNTRNKKCSSKNWTSCCPHMPPNEEGKYIATNEKTDLKYNNNIYVLHTCCLMCGQAMNELSNKNPNKFKKLYIHSIDKDGTILAKNQHTGVMVQKLKLK
tara:strand:- start:890 stop:1750 length:861 start_codon:yes stop_codon:yes gene_type:complete